VPDPVAEPLLAFIPLTDTDEIPLSPRPESEAVPDIVIVLLDTVCPLLLLLIERAGPIESVDAVEKLPVDDHAVVHSDTVIKRPARTLQKYVEPPANPLKT
jgi:hypothetical protein